MKGRIEKIEERKRGDKPFWVVSIDGERYSVWKPEYMDGLNPGVEVEYEFSAKGRFRNIGKLSRLGEGPDSTLNTQDPKPKTQDPAPKTQNSFDPDSFVPNDLITNMTSLKYATQTTQNLDMDGVDKANLTLGIAETYRAFMQGKEYKDRLEALRPKEEG